VAVLRGSVGTSYVNSRCPAWQIVVVERSVLTEINEDVMLWQPNLGKNKPKFHKFQFLARNLEILSM